MEIEITKKATLQPDVELEAIEELCGEEKPRPVIVNDIKYSSYEDYLKSRGKGNRNETTQ